jgi:hypothetical protein
MRRGVRKCSERRESIASDTIAILRSLPSSLDGCQGRLPVILGSTVIPVENSADVRVTPLKVAESLKREVGG